jgi:hypothetical protein
MQLRKYSIYKVEHLVEGGHFYMIYLGNNQFGLGKTCSTSALLSLKKDVLKKKANPAYDSLYTKTKSFNNYPQQVKVLGCVPLKSINVKLSFQDEWSVSYSAAVAKPKKDYSKMRILNRDS